MKKRIYIILISIIVIIAVISVCIHLNKQSSLNETVKTTEKATPTEMSTVEESVATPIEETPVEVASETSPETEVEPTEKEEIIEEKKEDITEKEEKKQQTYIVKTDNGYEYDLLIEFASIAAEHFGVSTEEMLEHVETHLDELYEMEDDYAVENFVFEYGDNAYSWKDCIKKLNKTMYAQSTTNVRSGHSTDYEKIGSLSPNQEVKVTGQSSETGWYEIEFDGRKGYVSDAHLGTTTVEVASNVTPETNSYVIPDGLENCTDWIPISSFEEGWAWMEKYTRGGIRVKDEQYFFQPNSGDGGKLIPNPHFMMGDGSGNYYDQYGNKVN